MTSWYCRGCLRRRRRGRDLVRCLKCCGWTNPPKTDDGAPAPGESPRPAAVSPAAPSSPFPRRFLVYRYVDVSGVSGVGVVAQGVQWSDGSVSIRWTGKHPSTVAWDNTDDVVAVHGHQGSTELRWLDEPAPPRPAAGDSR